MKVLNDILGYNNLKIYQDTEMFSFSLDSILLANFVQINQKTKQILDIGTGNAIIPIILSTKTAAPIVGVEIQSEVYSLAKESVSYNHLENQIYLVQADINEYVEKMKTDQIDVITCNPPFFKNKEKSNKNESIYKTIARHETHLKLEQIARISKKLLKNNGSLYLVHRPERLVDIISCLRENNLEIKRMRFVYPKEKENSNMLLIQATKNGKPGLKLLPPLYVHSQNGEYTKEVMKFFK